MIIPLIIQQNTPIIESVFKTTDSAAWGTSNYFDAYSNIKDIGGAFTFSATALVCNVPGFYSVTIQSELNVVTPGDREVELRYRQDPNTGTYDQLPENSCIMGSGAFANPSNHLKRYGSLHIPRVFIGLNHKVKIHRAERTLPAVVDGSYQDFTDSTFIKFVAVR